MKRLFTTISFIFCLLFAYAQSVSRDSLTKLLAGLTNHNLSQSARVDMLNATADACMRYNLDSAKLMADKALETARQINYSKGEADALLSLTTCYSNKADLSKGLEIGMLCAAKYESINNNKGLTDALLEIAMLYKKIGGHKITEEYILKGLDYSHRAYVIAADEKDTGNIIDALNMSGIIYRDWGKKPGSESYYDTAFIHYERCLKLIEQSNGRLDDYLGKIYNNISQVYIEHKKNYSKALEYLYKAVENNNRFNKVNSLSYNYGNISRTYISLGNKEKALEYAHKMLTISQKLNSPDRLEDSYMALSDAYEMNNQFDSALYYFKQSTHLGNSTLNLEKTAQIADMQTRYETLKKESEIAILNTSNKTKARNISALTIGLLALAGLVVAMVVLYQKVKNQKSQLQEQSAKLQWMMKELHHRVKNNLQIVSSLLNLQTYRMKDEASAMALNESNLRVQAMSLIHQRLYQAEDASLVNFRLFITDLAETLMAAYGFAGDDFDLHIDIQEEMLSVDAVLPLGLMVNEILTNAFKFAYKNVERPMLHIQLLRNGQQLQMEITDNGPGLGAGSQGTGGFGKSLIDAFTKQLHATCSISQHHGLSYHFTIPFNQKKTA